MSSFVTVHVVVEGKTEKEFVEALLVPGFATKNISLVPCQISKPGQKGGDVKFDRAKNDIGDFLKQRSDTYVTTMFDYFRIKPDWPGRETTESERHAMSVAKKAERIESATQEAVDKLFGRVNATMRFIPYIAMHEMEALLFSDAAKLATHLHVDISAIERILKKCGEPEKINESERTAPSKRLMELCSRYKKIDTGSLIAKDIGLAAMREKCPHFDGWLRTLENLRPLR